MFVDWRKEGAHEWHKKKEKVHHHHHHEHKRQTEMEWLAALKARDEDGIPVVGIDIAGAERGPIRVRVRELKGLGLVLVSSLSLGSW